MVKLPPQLFDLVKITPQSSKVDKKEQIFYSRLLLIKKISIHGIIISIKV